MLIFCLIFYFDNVFFGFAAHRAMCHTVATVAQVEEELRTDGGGVQQQQPRNQRIPLVQTMAIISVTVVPVPMPVLLCGAAAVVAVSTWTPGPRGTRLGLQGLAADQRGPHHLFLPQVVKLKKTMKIMIMFTPILVGRQCFPRYHFSNILTLRKSPSQETNERDL
jgi:hypothetical protein